MSDDQATTTCADRIARMHFNESWFYPHKKPHTWRLELAMYIICMVLLVASMTHRLLAQYLTNNDWLKARSRPMMVMCHVGALIQLQTGGLFSILGSQTQCWFNIIGSLMIVPLLIVPVILKLVWFKARAVYIEAAKKGAKRVVRGDTDPYEELPVSSMDRAAYLSNMLVARTSLVFTSTVSDQEDVKTAKKQLVRDLKRWKYLSSKSGMFWLTLAVFAPFVILTLVTFALTDSVFLTTCKGCTVQPVHIIFTGVFAGTLIFSALIFLYRLRKYPDPFGYLAEVRLAILVGGIPALIAYGLKSGIPYKKQPDGWSWNVLLELCLLVFSFVQGSLQVFISRRHHSSGDPPTRLSPELVRKKSLYDITTTLGVLFDSILAKKDLHDAFERYLCAEFAVESLAFVDAVMDYHSGYYDRGMVGSAAYARRIVRSFVTPEAPFSINVSAQQRSRLLDEMATRTPTEPPRIDIFDECMTEVKKMLELGPLVRFTQTNQFLKLVDEGAFRGTPAAGGNRISKTPSPARESLELPSAQIVNI